MSVTFYPEVIQYSKEDFPCYSVEETEKETQMQKITLDKKYRTRCGYPARVLCVDMKDEEYHVVALIEDSNGESPYCFTETGLEINSGISSGYDLIEVSPWEDFKKDDKVMVSNDGTNWVKRHFSHEEDEIPWCYNNGNTSFTTKDTSSWLYCRKPAQEELEG